MKKVKVVVKEAPEDNAAIDAQADELLDQIKAAANNIKQAEGGDVNAQTEALDALSKINLLQVDSDIKLENEPEAD